MERPKHNGTGTESASISQGSLVGCAAYLSSTRAWATVTAAQTCKVAAFGNQELEMVQVSAVTRLASRMHHTWQHLRELHLISMQAMERTAWCLLAPSQLLQLQAWLFVFMSQAGLHSKIKIAGCPADEGSERRVACQEVLAPRDGRCQADGQAASTSAPSITTCIFTHACALCGSFSTLAVLQSVHQGREAAPASKLLTSSPPQPRGCSDADSW